MNKKKAFKVATAASVAASAFVAAIPATQAASVTEGRARVAHAEKLAAELKTLIESKPTNAYTVETKIKQVMRGQDIAAQVVREVSSAEKKELSTRLYRINYGLKTAEAYLTHMEQIDLKLSGISHKSTVKDEKQTLTVSAHEKAKITVTVNGKVVEGLERAYEVMLAEDLEWNKVEVTAEYLGAKVYSAKWVKLDKTAPELKVSELEETVTEAKQTVEVTTEEGAAVVVTLNGTEVSATDGKYELTLVEGENNLVVTSTDKAGNESKVEKKVVLDAKAAVESVSAITKTDVTVTLAKAPTADLTNEDAGKFGVKIGEEAVAVTAVTKVASDLTGKTYKLSVALDGKEGIVSVNGTSSSVVDFKAPAIAKVTPISDTQIRVEYSEAVTEATAKVKGNYSIVESDLPINSVNIIAVNKIDDKTFEIITASQTKDKNYTLYVTGVKDATGNATAKPQSTSFVAVKDVVAPSITGVTSLDTNHVEVTFDETVKGTFVPVIKGYNDQGVLVDTNLYTGGTATVNGNKLVIRTTNATALTKGKTYNVALTGGTDISGNEAKVNSDFVAGKDDVKPTVVGNVQVVGKQEVKVEFSEALTGLTTGENFAVYETLTGKPVSGAGITLEKAQDDKSVSIKFAGASTLDASKQYSIRITGLQDKAATPNSIAQTVVSFTTPATDVVLAEVSSVAAGTDGKSVNIQFNRALTGEELTAAKNIASYAIARLDNGSALSVTKVETSDNTTFTLTTDNQNELGLNASNKNYKLTVSGVPNLTTDVTKFTKEFKGTDKVAASLTGIETVTTNIIDLVFDENVAQSVAPATTVKLVQKDDITTTKVGTVVGTTGNKLRVVFEDTETLTAGKDYILQVSNVTDASTAKNVTASQTKEFKAAAADAVAPTITGVNVQSEGKVVLSFNEEVELSDANADLAITLKDLSSAANPAKTLNSLGVTVAKDPTNPKNLVLTKASGFLTDGVNYELSVVEALDVDGNVVGSVSDISGNNVKTAKIQLAGKQDLVKPKLLGAVASKDNEITLTFDKEMADPSAAVESFLVTKVADGTSLAVKTAALDAKDAHKVVLTLDGDVTEYGVDYKVFIDAALKDASIQQNTLDANTRLATFTGVDTTAPVFETAKLTSSSTMVLTFADTIDAGTVQASDFVIDNGDKVVTVSTAKVSTDKKTVTLTFSKLADTSAVAELAVSLAAGQTVADEHGVELGGTAKTLISDDVTDSAAPELVKAVKASSTTLTLTFSENLAAIAGLTPEQIAATLSVDGYTVTGISAIADQNTVTVTVGSAMPAADYPLVSLKKDQSVIKDTAGTANVYVGGEVVTPVAGN